MPASAPRAFTDQESPTCAAINSNASLENSYSGFYYSLANNSPNWGKGPNSTTPVNQSGYPNATLGGKIVVQAWISICDSPAYMALYDAWGPNAVISGSELASDGHYEFNYGVYFHASCTNSTDTSSTACGYETTWTLDLVTGVVTGPATANEGPPLRGPPPAGASATPAPTPWWALSASDLYAIGAATAVAAVILGYVGWRRARRR